MRPFAFLAAMLCASLAHAQTDHKQGSWSDWIELGAMTNCSVASINSAVICGSTRGIKVQGYNFLTLEILYTQSAGTGYSFYLETCYEGHASTDCTGATDWYRVVTESVVAGTGISLTADPFIHLTAASDRITYTIPINYLRLRLNAMTASGSPDANDKITVSARLNWVPSL